MKGCLVAILKTGFLVVYVLFLAISSFMVLKYLGAHKMMGADVLQLIAVIQACLLHGLFYLIYKSASWVFRAAKNIEQPKPR